MFNLVIVLLLTFAISFVLIFFIAAHDRKLKQKMLCQGSTTELNESQKEEAFRTFVKFCTDLCEYLKLEATSVERPLANEVVMHAQSVNPITRVEYLIVGFFINDNETIDTMQITAISDQIVSERLSKAILITPGKFPETVKSLPELAPMEFIDGTKMAELKKKMIL